MSSTNSVKTVKSSYVRQADIPAKVQEIENQNVTYQKDITDLVSEFDFDKINNTEYVKEFKLRTTKLTNFLGRRVRMIIRNNNRIEKLNSKTFNNKNKRSYYVKKEEIPNKIAELQSKIYQILEDISNQIKIKANIKL